MAGFFKTFLRGLRVLLAFACIVARISILVEHLQQHFRRNREIAILKKVECHTRTQFLRPVVGGRCYRSYRGLLGIISATRRLPPGRRI